MELKIKHLRKQFKDKNAVDDVSINVRSGEIVCIAGIDGNGQTEFVHAITGLEKVHSGTITFMGNDITKETIRYRNTRKTGAIIEGITVDARHTVRDCHTRKPSTIIEGILVDVCHTVRDRYARKPGASTEGRTGNA